MFEFIRRIYSDKYEFKIVVKFSTIFLLIFLLYLIANYFTIYFLSINDIKKYLEGAATNVASDFDYKDGQWNTDKYISDVSTPTEIPLYVYSTDGFLMDRLNIIHGFLDTSNFDYASSFTAPKTFTSLAGETWRAYSHLIQRNGQIEGVILVAYFKPTDIPETDIDLILQETALNIDSKIQHSGGKLDVTDVIQKDINLSYEIVDKFNRILASYGGPPAYIDKSYVQDALSQKDYRTFEDTLTKEKYLLYTKPIMSNDRVIGVVVTGKGLDQLEKISGYQLWLSTAAGTLAIVLFVIIVMYIYRHDISDIVQERLSLLSNPAPPTIKSLSFDDDKSIIEVNKEINIPIPHNSRQFDVCRLIFRSPHKKFETDDFVDAMGEKGTSTNETRMVYDAILAINDKVRKILRVQFIQRKESQYFINPELTSKIRR